ncbi:MAG: four helix bundle protein [Candidatus Magasanikbacteria bacterium]|nr:four helix bundle protein [Candidatus Magasanikbacteria bacterium]
MPNFCDELKLKMHEYVKNAYHLARKFPTEELYGVTSQLRRSALSVILNFIEGYARFKPGDKLRFWEISYASLKESKYLLYFSMTEDYLTKEEYKQILTNAEEVGKMLWRVMSPLREGK